MKFVVVIPEIEGPDLVYPSEALAYREANNARSLGYEASVHVLDMVGAS